MLSRSRLGFEIRVQGENPDAARYAGISSLKTTVLVMVLSGGAAALAGVGEVAGVQHKLLDPNQVSRCPRGGRRLAKMAHCSR